MRRHHDPPPGAGELVASDPLAYKSARGRWVIAATVLGSGIASLDATVVSIALPQIGRSFHAGVETLQWVVTGYGITLAAFLLVGGSLGDRLGRRKVFAVGVVWFALASVVCGVAPDAPLLIAARVLQGIGGALLTPASLAIIEASFRPDDRARAIGAWSGLSGLATAAGPLVGGELIAIGSWRWIFFINVPVGAAVLLVSSRHVPESVDPSAGHHIDAAGSVAGAACLGGLVYALIEGPTAGWGAPLVVAALAVAVAGLIAFPAIERRVASPMLPLAMFRVRQFAAANLVTFVVYGALGGAIFLLPVELEVVSHYSALGAGLSFLPLTAIMLVFSPRSGRLAQRIGPRVQMAVGPVVAGAGVVLLARAGPSASYVSDVLPAVVVLGAGLALTVAPLTTTALGSAPAEHAGIASAVNNAVARAAGLVAVAVLPLAAGIEGAGALRPLALRAGFTTACLIAGAICAAGGVLAAAAIRDPPGSERLSELIRHPRPAVVPAAPLA